VSDDRTGRAFGDNYELESYRQAPHLEVDSRGAGVVQDRVDQVKSLSTNQFLVDATYYATMLQNLLGDADGVVAEFCTNICSDINVVVEEVARDPVGFVLSHVRSLDSDEEKAVSARAMAMRLNAFADQIRGGE